MTRIRLVAWPYNGGRYTSPALCASVGDVVEVSDEAAASLSVTFPGCWETAVPQPRMRVADALAAGGVSAKAIGALERGGLLGPALLSKSEEDLIAVKGIGASTARKILDALSACRR